jgi:tetratricopeptide (TPR) repeat protein
VPELTGLKYYNTASNSERGGNLKKIRKIIGFVFLIYIISLVCNFAFIQTGSGIGPPDEGPLECAFYLAQNSSNKVLDMMKIAFVYTNAKQYAQSLFLAGFIGNEVFTEFYILPAIVWGYGMEQNYTQARPLVDSIKNPQAKLVALTWLAKTYIVHHRDAAKLLKEAEQLAAAMIKQWLGTPYTAGNYMDFLKRADALVNLSEAEFQTGRKTETNRILNLAAAFIRFASLESGLEFLKGTALAGVAHNRYQSGYRTAGSGLMAEAEKYILESAAVSVNSPALIELAITYAKMRKFDKALQIAGLIQNEPESSYRFFCLEKIGAEYYQAGQKAKATAVWQRILAEIRDGDVPRQIQWWGNVAVDFYQVGQAGEAGNLLQQALGIAVRQKDQSLKDAYPEALMVIAGKYREIGERDSALRLMGEIYELFQTLRLRNMMDGTPNQLVVAHNQPIPYCSIATIGDIPAQVRSDLLGIDLASEYARLGVHLRALQVIRLLSLIENKVEGLIWVGKAFGDDGITVNDEMRKILREIAQEGA